MLHVYKHPSRKELHKELHARPSLYFAGDTDVWPVPLSVKMVLLGEPYVTCGEVSSAVSTITRKNPSC